VQESVSADVLPSHTNARLPTADQHYSIIQQQLTIN